MAVLLPSKKILSTLALTSLLSLIISPNPTHALFTTSTTERKIGDAVSTTKSDTAATRRTTATTDKPTVPTLCTSSNRGDCECGQDSNKNVITYVWWIPGNHQRCIHTFNLDSSSGSSSNDKKPVFLSVGGYGQGMLEAMARDRATHYGYAAIGIGSTEFDGAGGFGLEFPNDGVANADNPTPCGPDDSRDWAYIHDTLDFIAGYGTLDVEKVYAEGFSQNSMFAAYIGICFADRMTGIFQGGSGLAKTGYTPIVPGKQAQCTFSDHEELGGQCCKTRFCEECDWWPVYPRTCDNKIIDCIATYTNDNIACGSDLYMYEAMVTESNDARLLSFSPQGSSTGGGHRNPDHEYDWMVGCLGIVQSCSDQCQTLFLDCVDTTNSFESCQDSLENGSWEATCSQGCALTLEMLQRSESPVVTLSDGTFGSRTDYTAAGSEPAPAPVCQNDFGTFQEVNYNACSSDAEPPTIGPIEPCGPTAPTTSSPVAAPTPVAPTTPAPIGSGPLCGQDCEEEWPSCVNFHGEDGCDVCSEELLNPASTLVDRGNCVVGCALTDAMLEICGDGPSPPTDPPVEPTTPAPVASSTECGQDCEDEWPNCVNFHGEDGCDTCSGELLDPNSLLVNKGNCVVGCALTDAMLEVCGDDPSPPTDPPVEPITPAPSASDTECTQKPFGSFYYKTNKKGKDIIKSCSWLDKKSEKKVGKICAKQVKHLAEGDVTEPAQDVCQKSCDSCDACYQNNRSRFFSGKYKDGSPLSITCKSLKKKSVKKIDEFCLMTEVDVYGPAREVCPKTCEIGDC